jgi:hypothetical protein
MNKAIARKWVRALLSGKYQQGRGTLRRSENYCCLGVLCDIYRKDVGGSWERRGVEDTFAFVATPDESTTTSLPPKVMDWADLDIFVEEDLIRLNDHPRRFSTIAKHIAREAEIPLPKKKAVA